MAAVAGWLEKGAVAYKLRLSPQPGPLIDSPGEGPGREPERTPPLPPTLPLPSRYGIHRLHPAPKPLSSCEASSPGPSSLPLLAIAYRTSSLVSDGPGALLRWLPLSPPLSPEGYVAF